MFAEFFCVTFLVAGELSNTVDEEESECCCETHRNNNNVAKNPRLTSRQVRIKEPSEESEFSDRAAHTHTTVQI